MLITQANRAGCYGGDSYNVTYFFLSFKVSGLATQFLFRGVHLVFEKNAMHLYSNIKQFKNIPKTCDFHL